MSGARWRFKGKVGGWGVEVLIGTHLVTTHPN